MDNFNSAFDAGISTASTIDPVLSKPVFVLNSRFEVVWYNSVLRDLVATGVDRASQMRESVVPISGLSSGTSSHDLALSLEPVVGEIKDQFTRNIKDDIHAVFSVDCQFCDRVACWRVDESYFVACLSSSNAHSLIEFLCSNDVVLAKLARQRLPIYSDVTVLLADIESSSQICAELPPDEYFNLINQFWLAAQGAISLNFGVSGKHSGDGITAFFIDNSENRNTVHSAVNAALEIKKACAEIDADWRRFKRWGREIKVNLAINHGKEWVGFFASEKNVELAVLGDSVNQASRLCDYAKGGSLWITKKALFEIPRENLADINYGSYVPTAEGSKIWVEKTFTQVSASELTDAHSYSLANTPIAQVISQ